MSPTPFPSSSGADAKFAWRDIPRAEPPKRPVAERLGGFGEVGLPYDEETAKAQASRCVQCPNANCVTACPLGAPIMELMTLTAGGQFADAAQLLFATHYLPEIASHVCVGGRVCETVCVVGSKAEAVSPRHIPS